MTWSPLRGWLVILASRHPSRDFEAAARREDHVRCRQFGKQSAGVSTGYATDEVLCRRSWGFGLDGIGVQVSRQGVMPAHASALASDAPGPSPHRSHTRTRLDPRPLERDRAAAGHLDGPRSELLVRPAIGCVDSGRAGLGLPSLRVVGLAGSGHRWLARAVGVGRGSVPIPHESARLSSPASGHKMDPAADRCRLRAEARRANESHRVTTAGRRWTRRLEDATQLDAAVRAFEPRIRQVFGTGSASCAAAR